MENELQRVEDLSPSTIATTPADQHPAAVYLARLSPGGARSMRSALRTVLRTISSESTIETFPWSSLRYQHVAMIRARLAEKYAPATANQAISALRGVLKESFRLGQLSAEEYARATDVDPVAGTRLAAGRALSAGERAALFAACGDGVKGVRDYAILAVLYGAGLRRSELCGLSVEDWDGRSLRVRGKGNKERLVPLPAGSAAALVRWLTMMDRAGSEALFVPVSKIGSIRVRSRLTGESVLKILREIAQAADVKAFTPHDLRRSFIGDVLDAGADLATAQKLAGHSDPATTAKYDRRGEAAKQRAVDLLHVPEKA